MSNILRQNIVLVLNRNWQAVNVRTPEEVFPQLATGVATALDINGRNEIRAVKWEEWITLPVREQDRAVRTVKGAIRIPTVVVLANYAKMPKKRPKLSPRGIRERDRNRCQYTNRLLKPEEGSLDHVIPRSRGGRNTWENLVWASKEINARKGNRLPEEAGLRLLAVPRKPQEVPAIRLIQNTPQISEWDMFLMKF